MKATILEVIDAYEERIQIVNGIIEGSHQVIANYRRQRESMSDELRDNLAHTESLRRKDFDDMMAQVYSRYGETERGVKAMLLKYVHEHQNMAEKLRSLLEDSGQDDHRDEKERLLEFQTRFEIIKKEQEEREREVREMLAKYQYEHNNYFKVMNSLLHKGRDIHLPEVKQAMWDLSEESIHHEY